MAKFARKLGFSDQLFENIKVNATTDESDVEDIIREINKGMWTIGYTGQSPEWLRIPCSHSRRRREPTP